jgi:transposase
MGDQSAIAEVFGGVDTHAHTHHAAVIDSLGRELADHESRRHPPATTRSGSGWLPSVGSPP